MGLKEIVPILRCPVSGAPLVYNEKANALDCKESGLRYPIDGDVVHLLPEEALDLPPNDEESEDNGDAA
ncbi:MAG: Trm112 family protein [Deltaproteobacteria bacterium]|nr:Trm112 family protein [bacterium]MCB9479763.1 Trm112 family protein [Deltaproteobacteria bacterium]MCB9487533.1 Trm112 family protein [Deltaproteobacteria bacterium]